MIHYAASHGDSARVKELVKEGQDINEQGRRGFTPLITAVY